jgi:hypothetical protein
MPQKLVMIRIEICNGACTGLRLSPRPVLGSPLGSERAKRLAVGFSEGNLEDATWEDAEWR